MKPTDVLDRALQSLKNDTGPRQLPSMLPDTLTDARLNEEVREMLVAHVPPSDLSVLRACGQSWARALKLAKNGGLAEAAEIFCDISQVMDRADLADETRLVCESFSSGAAAFVDYKRKRWDLAKQRILRALACDDDLENKFGYGILHLHRLTLLENLIRVERKAGNAECAAKLAGNILVYLSGGSSRVEIGGSWGWQQLSLPLGNIRFRFASVSADIAQSLACIEFAEAAGLFAISSEFLHKPLVQAHVDADALRWFEGKDSFLAGKTDQFLIHGEAILSRPPARTGNPKLWCAALLDVMTLCESNPDGASREIGEIASLFGKCGFWTAPVRAYLSSRKIWSIAQN